MKVKELVKKYGGQTALAELLGVGQSAIAYWVKKESVPTKWHNRLLSIANEKGIDIFAADLIAVELSGTNQSTEHVKNTVAETTAFSVSAVTQESPNTTEGAQQFLFYASENGTTKVQVLLGDDTVWASQKGMAEIFNVDVSTINHHIKNIYSSGELDYQRTIRKFPIVQMEGERQVRREGIEFYNLDVIISVGYRVNSYQATQFRKWATTVLREYLIKGFALDDERLKQGNQLFGKDYFDDLLERIRKIRTSERMFWQKVTDLYSQCSVDYDKNAPVTQNFFAQIQNKFHYAIHHHTAAELITIRADARKTNMGLVHFANMHKDGVILKSDAAVGKNYLTLEELDELERLVENYLGSAELLARRKIVMTMKDWVQKLDDFLRFNAYDVLSNFGTVSSKVAVKHASAEYDKFRIKHEKEFKSDFDKVVDEIRIKKRLPKS
jgi:predicted transcriptional regulator